jgi:hypothetical protein
MMLRNTILVGVCTCVAAVAYSIARYPLIIASPGTPIFLSLFLAGVVWYAFAALRWTRVATSEDLLVLHRGMRWGVLIGLVWTVEVVSGNLIMQHQLGSRIGGLAALLAAILPAIAGASGAVVTRRASTGARIGFWSGVVSGLITFVTIVAVGYLVVYFPGFPGVETPHHVSKALTAEELAAFNIGDYLAGGVSHLVLIGAPFCSLAGLIGGLLMRGSKVS